MIDKIKIQVDGKLYAGENNSNYLYLDNFEPDPSKQYYMRLKATDGNKYIALLGDDYKVMITNGLIPVAGTLSAELCEQDGQGYVALSSVQTFNVATSLQNADDTPPTHDQAQMLVQQAIAYYEMAQDEIQGESAYEVAVNNGYLGTEEEWLASIKGAKGDKGDKGDAGLTRISVSDACNSVKYIGHRGLSGIAPENTIPAFAAAGTHGMWGAECDIWETSDGKFVVLHNETIDASTNGTGKVASYTMTQLKGYTVDLGNNIANYPGLKLPTLEEYLDCCRIHSLIPVVEIKSMSTASVSNFLAVLKDKGVEKTVVIISFDHDVLDTIRTMSDVNMQYLYTASTLTASNYKTQIDKVMTIGNADIDVAYAAITSDIVDYAHSLGIKVNAWTVDDPDKACDLIGMGVDYITSNILIDGSNLPQKSAEQITVNSGNTAARYIASVLSQGDSLATVESDTGIGMYYYDDTHNILAIHAIGNGAVQHTFGCRSGDVVEVELEYQCVDGSTAKIVVGDYALTLDESDGWHQAKLAIPITADGTCETKIDYIVGVCKFKNVTMRHIKYTDPTPIWINPTLAEPATHYPGNEVRYCKINGIVYIQGWLKQWTPSAAVNGDAGLAAIVFTLPEGYRPGQELNVTVPTSSSSTVALGVGRIQIKPNGQVRISGESIEGAVYKGCSACVPPFLAEN